MANKSQAQAYKAEGNAAFSGRNFDLAIEKYTQAINSDPTDGVLYSNRCAAHSGKGDFESAKNDAAACVQLKPEWAKGYFRLGSAQKELGNFVEAEKAVRAGLRVQSDHADLMRLKEEIEAAEKSGRKFLGKADRLKAEGNEFFKNSRFDMAIEKYTAALDSMSADERESSALAVSCLNNRAACNQQISNFQAVIEDTSCVIEIDPQNMKALLRRGLAFEGLERYRSALADIRAVLAIDPTVEVANRAQHRLGASVRALKKANAQNL